MGYTLKSGLPVGSEHDCRQIVWLLRHPDDTVDKDEHVLCKNIAILERINQKIKLTCLQSKIAHS